MIEPRIRGLLDQALAYRGFVTLVRRDGTRQVGFVYERGRTHVEMFDEDASSRIRIALEDVRDVELTGEDCAAQAHRRSGAASAASAASAARSSAPRARSHVSILVALRPELACVSRALGAPIDGATVRGRLGAYRAVARAVGVGGGAARTIAAEQPGLVIACGFAGALDPALATGTIVLASSIHDELGAHIELAAPRLAAARRALAVGGGLRVAEGELLCATEVAATGADKRAHARPGRLAIDLESGPAARAAERAGIPWLAIRAILDPLDLELPAFAREARRGYLAPALRHALRGPGRVRQLAALALRARSAGRALAAALDRLGPALATLAPLEPST